MCMLAFLISELNYFTSRSASTNCLCLLLQNCFVLLRKDKNTYIQNYLHLLDLAHPCLTFMKHVEVRCPDSTTVSLANVGHLGLLKSSFLNLSYGLKKVSSTQQLTGQAGRCTCSLTHTGWTKTTFFYTTAHRLDTQVCTQTHTHACSLGNSTINITPKLTCIILAWM